MGNILVIIFSIRENREEVKQRYDGGKSHVIEFRDGNPGSISIPAKPYDISRFEPSG